MSESQTVNVRVTTPNKALQFIVGAIVICLIWKAWRAGWAYDIGFDVFNRSPEVSGDGMRSVTGAGALIVLVIDAVCLLGMAIVFFFSGLWSVVMDLTQTARDYVVSGTSKLSKPADPQAAAKPPEQPKALDPRKVAAAFKNLDERLKKLEPQPEPEPVPETEAEKLDRLEKLVATLVEKQAPATKAPTKRKTGAAK